MDDNSISLYFGLKEGRHADLEVAAAAAIEWVQIVRAAAIAIDPEADIRVELIDASESSLRFNAIFDWAESQLEKIDKGSSRYPRLRKLAIALAAFVIIDAPDTYQQYFGEDKQIEIQETDRELLEEWLERMREADDLEKPKRRFYRTLERDPAIKEVGISESRESEPILKIPSTEFAERGGLWAIVEEEAEYTSQSIIDVYLISPALVSKPRSWKFQPIDGSPEFNAVMRDRRFLEALQESHIQEKLRVGIQMKIRLEIAQEKINGVWRVKHMGRSVIEVLSPRAG